MKSKEIRRENDRFYYCKDYIWALGRRYGVGYPVMFLFTIEIIFYWIRNLILKRQFIEQASVENLGYEDVMHWVEARVREQKFDAGFAIIIIFSILIIFIMLLRFMRIIKSYNLYKKPWIRGALVIVFIFEAFAIALNYKLIPRKENIEIYIMMIADIVPILFSSKMLYPLESRPATDEDKAIFKVFDIATKIIMKRL